MNLPLNANDWEKERQQLIDEHRRKMFEQTGWEKDRLIHDHQLKMLLQTARIQDWEEKEV